MVEEDFDIIIKWIDQKKTLRLRLTDKTLTEQGQHGKSSLFEDNQGQLWIMKIFTSAIDEDSKEIKLIDVDLNANPDSMKNRLHLWRVLNEYTASKIALKLGINVPEAYLITSGLIGNIELKPDTELPISSDEIILDNDFGAADTGEEFYQLSKRENYTITTSESFEQFLSKNNNDKEASFVISVLIKFIPNSTNLDNYLDSKADFEVAVNKIRELENGYKLLPFDVWLNDPDRNQGNYLIQSHESEPTDVFGLDYEMWSFGSDIWMSEDEITMGRSYLTAVIHNTTNLFDDNILETIFKISAISDADLKQLILAPKIICQFIEYHIRQGSLKTDERDKLKIIEQNNLDFLIETRPKFKSENLIIRIMNQIGLPANLKDIEKILLRNDEIENE